MHSTPMKSTMPLTPDRELELLFDPKLIPQSARDELPAGLHMRPLALTDHSRGHLRVLSILSPSPEPGKAVYEEQFHFLRSLPLTYFTIVIVEEATDTIIATGTIIVERKFVRGLSRVSHIEDVAVDKERKGGRRLGWHIVKGLVEICAGQGCYKIAGYTFEHNLAFYDKVGAEFEGWELKQHLAITLKKKAEARL